MLAGTLEVQMLTNIARLSDDMNKAKTMVGNAMGNIEKAVESAKSALGALGIGLSINYFASLVKGSIDAADHLNDLRKSTDISVQNLAGLKLLAQQTGTDLDGLAKGINKMSVEMGKAPEKFRALGVTAQDNIGAFKQLADLFNSMTDINQRNALAQAVFNKSWQELAPALSEGSKGIQEAIEKGARLSGMTQDIAQKSDELNDKWIELVGTGGALNRVLAVLLDPLIRLTDQMIAARDGADGLGSAMGRFFSISGAQAKNPAAALEDINTKLTALRATEESFAGMGLMKRIFSADDVKIVQAQIAFLQTQKDMLSRVQDAGSKGANSGRGSIVPGFNYIDPADASKAAQDFIDFSKNEAEGKAAQKRADAEKLAQAKLYNNALQSLEEESGKLNGMTKEEIVTNRLLGGSWESIWEDHGKELIQKAREIDIDHQRIELSKAEIASIEAIEKARQSSTSVLSLANAANREELRQRSFDISTIGKTVAEVEKMTAARAIDLKLIQDLKAASAESDDPYGSPIFNGTAGALSKAAAEQKKLVGESIEARLAAERSWATGAGVAFQDYIDHATNAAEQSRNLFTRAFSSMEDALVQFATTGKLDFKSLANSIISDLIRIQVRAALARAAGAANGGEGGGMLSMFGSLFGGGGATSGTLANGGAEVFSPGFATGGRFTVGGTGGVDTTPVGFMATPGEKVNIERPGQQGDQSQGSVVNIDARGADRAGLARLEALFRQLNASVEHRALGAVLGAARSNPALAAQLKGNR